ncbi:DUF364 domain-containing protein [Desulfoplanes formicivorans]|uniref:Fis family transcriptional regulator n=1 Tax=Desulfoplanes formicivorans TaxID=1592317 RepID=A0A194AF45_9BACT|nr:DUF364 domain-containing protein [Desulfoplanes formicivorans]GAU07404.1 hypothetical protein DPF_0082 [Desulfoplanes formicivorans]
MSPTIRTRLKENALSLAQDRTVADVRIGLGYTAVQLDNGQTGVACTFHKDAKGGCTVFQGLRPLKGTPAAKVLTMLDATDPIASAVAIATSNALTNTPSPDMTTGDILENITLYPDDHVGMVGFFAPVIPKLKERTGRLDIFEKQDRGPGTLPADAARDILPSCQVAVITSTSIINHTVDDLLNACTNCREVIMLGASTPLLPTVFARTPVTVLSGIIVTQPENILQIVSEGGGMQLFKKNIHKVNCRVQK